jgi:hypothetical protein
MALGVGDVKNIVDSKIGGMTLIPATTTIIEGKVVTPQISSVCSLGGTFDKLKGDLSSAVAGAKDAYGKAITDGKTAFNNIYSDIDKAVVDFKSGVNTHVINPIAAKSADALASINSAISGIQTKIGGGGLSPSLTTALNDALAKLNSAKTSVTDATAHATSLVSEKFDQVMAAMSFCSPTQCPSVKQYKPTDLTATLSEGPRIDDMKAQAVSILATVNSTSGTEADRITAMNTLGTSLNTNLTTLSSTVASDVSNLSAAQTQNEALSKLTTMANGLNNPNTKDFILSITDPNSKDLIGKMQIAMKNVTA